MRKALVAVFIAAAAMGTIASAAAQETVKIGLILAYSGQFADPSAQMARIEPAVKANLEVGVHAAIAGVGVDFAVEIARQGYANGPGARSGAWEPPPGAAHSGRPQR